MNYFKYHAGAELIPLFGAAHLITLGIIVIICTGVIILARRKSSGFVRKTELILVALILLSEAARETALAFNHAYSIDQLPLHVCSLGVFCSMIYVMRRVKIAGELLYCLFMPGALIALLFPGWSGLPTTSFFCLNSFVVHTLLFLYPLMLLVTGRIIPGAKRLPLCLAVIIICAAPLYFLDRATGANYFFLSYAPPGSPLEPFYRLWGDPCYILGYFPLLAAAWAILYTPLIIIRKDKRK